MSTPTKYEGHTPGPWKWGDGWKEWDESPWDTRTDYPGPKYLDIALHGDGREIIPVRIDHHQIEWDAYNGIGDLIPADRALIADAPALLAENTRLREALRAMLKLLDEGKLVRNISGDGASDWAIKQLPMIQVLSAAAKLAYPDEALAAGKGERP